MGYRGSRTAAAWILACAIALLAPPAAAQSPSIPAVSQDDDRPWARGVPDAEQAAARALYAEGNTEFAESRFAQALAKYREAIRHWDHPAIRFNMAVCLINLDRVVEARDSLERSLAFGADAIGSDAYAQGLTYRKLLETQLAHVRVACTEPDAVVTVDGHYLFTAPGSAEPLLSPGEHQLAATKPGFHTAVLTFTGVAGKHAAFDLRPTPEVRTVPPRWGYWKHVLGGGAALAAAGAVIYLSARSDLGDYDDTVNTRCLDGCDAAMLREFSYLHDHYRMKQNVAFAAFAIAGGAIAVGAIGLIVDQQRVRAQAGAVKAAIAPLPGGAAASLGWAF